jgi:predicted  nucleic acid-binding Zn-ribbon protein
MEDMKPENVINELKNTLDVLLDEFKKIYVLSKMYPTNEEYQQQYANIIAGLDQIQSKLFTTSNNVQINIDALNKEMVKLDVEIKKEREKNANLKIKLGIVENESNASSEMIKDYTQIYDKLYLRNWALGLSTLLCIAAIKVTF